LNGKTYNIVLVGAGNVASHLGPALKAQGHQIVQVFSQTARSARALSEKLGTGYVTELAELDYSADLFLFCLKDDVLLNVLKQTRFTNQILIHTAGSLPMNIFKDFGFHYGVIYPVQTLIKERELDLTSVPFCVEANTPYAESIVVSLASGISRKVEIIDSDKRKIIHLAAVFACNFTNHMFYIAEKLMHDNGLEFDILKPLIQETFDKIMETDPETAQTGPAKRGDLKILSEHLSLLKDYPGIQKIYTFVSESIAESSKTAENRQKINSEIKNQNKI
jgi:predicted short-subunit dehydrogenase-like oxidoreductase (DUF2520 family)